MIRSSSFDNLPAINNYGVEEASLPSDVNTQALKEKLSNPKEETLTITIGKVSYATHMIQNNPCKGKFGQVFTATVPHHSPIVALKIVSLDEKGAKRQANNLTEARIALHMRRDSSPYVLGAYQVGFIQSDREPSNPNIVDRTNSLMFISMPYADGGSLQSWIDSSSLRPFTKKVEVLHGISLGIKHLHESGIMHRDIKTTNVVFKKNRPVLIDFGLSKYVQDNITKHEGSLSHMSPEVLAANSFYKKEISDPCVLDKLSKPHTEKVDVFSFGILIYNCITSTPAFSLDRTGMSIRDADIPFNVPPNRLKKFVPKDSPLHTDIEQLVNLCGELLPEDRPSIDEVSASLENLRKKCPDSTGCKTS